MKITLKTADGHSFTCDVEHVTRWLGRNQWVKLDSKDVVLRVSSRKESEATLAFLWVKALKNTLWWRK